MKRRNLFCSSVAFFVALAELKAGKAVSLSTYRGLSHFQAVEFDEVRRLNATRLILVPK